MVRVESQGNDWMKTQTIPLFGSQNQRDTSTKDRRFVNVLFDVNTDQLTNNAEVFCSKRPGLSNSTQPPGASAVGRGIHAWGANGKIYSVFDNRIYSGTSAIGATLAGSSGRVWFRETPEGASTRVLIACDGSDTYHIQTTDTVDQFDETDSTAFPTSNLGSMALLDGYFFLAQSDGDIWNSNLNAYTVWTSTNFLRANTHGDNLEAIHLLRDQIIAFGKNSIEFFFNNGNSSGSPLLRIDQNTLGVGLAAKETLAWSGDTLCFVSENASNGDGERGVWIISGSTAKEISTASINRFLKAEGSSISSATAWMEKVSGQLIYVLNLSSANRTFVYSVGNGMWCEWESSTSGQKFRGVAVSSLNGTVYVQDSSNGRIYTLDSSSFQDSGSAYTATMQTVRSDRGTHKRKSANELEIIGDTSSGDLTVFLSDDDGANYRTAGVVDMSATRKRLHRLGLYRERAYRLTHSANASLRLQALRETFEVEAA